MQTILVHEDRSVVQIVLNRPDVRNAFSAQMIEEITQVFQSLSQRNDLRVVHLKGAGRVFCAGADLGYMKEMVQFQIEQNQNDAKKLAAMFESLYACRVPIVTEVHGAAFGGALGLIAVSDVVIADDKTQFCFSEVKLGIAPAVISDFILRKCSRAHVQGAMLTGQIFGTQAALRMGLVHETAATSEALVIKTQESLQAFKESGPEAVAATKKLLSTIVPGTTSSLEQTTRLIAERRVSPEGQEGLQSFLEKRQPSWRLP